MRYHKSVINGMSLLLFCIRYLYELEWFATILDSIHGNYGFRSYFTSCAKDHHHPK